ncbi:MAG: cytochrome c3 family protein [Zoogloea sp.]|nr:cytochrome c3 family protein [Zoogloea sp.]
MAQVFSPFAVLAIKLALIAVVVLATVAVGLYHWRAGMPEAIGAPPLQPIPFSHKHHVGDDGIDCRYCHASVEKSRFAGLPSTSICLSCHSQLFSDAPLLARLRQSLASGRPIAWRRVHDLPDFVYFDHSIHVAKGVSCGECHGPVDQMPLTWRLASLDMQWCLGCHRAPDTHLQWPRHAVSARTAALDPSELEMLKRILRLQGERRMTDCSTCHR